MEFIFNKNAGHYYTSAKKLFLPVQIIHDIEGFFFPLGKKNYFFRGFETPLNNTASENLARNKYCTNKLLHAAGISVPKATAIHINAFKEGRLEQIIAGFNFPLVVKPSVGSQGQDVVCNIANLEQLKSQMIRIFPANEWLSIEEFHAHPNSYRILVLHKKIIGVIQRYPAQVVGNGEHTLTERIQSANILRQATNAILAPIILDDECHFRLKQLGITPDYIPGINERVILCHTCNASRGGTFEAIPPRMCKENRELFLKITTLLNLNIAGIDVECTDLQTPLTKDTGIIIEVNSSPSVRIHETPQAGKPNPVTQKVIRSIIYRHPLAYIHVLYKNKSTSMYVRSVMALPILISLYLLIKTLL